jgi:hypothetical protein
MLRFLVAPLAGVAVIAMAGAAQSAILVYTASMTGANEVPTNASLATGFTTVTIDDALNTMGVDISFNGLTTPATAALIHCCVPAGTSGPVAVAVPAFPTVTSGSHFQLFDLTSLTTYTAAFVTNSGGTAAGAEATLLAALSSGLAYSSLHDTLFPGGEIRGQLAGVSATATVPEPGTWALMVLGFGLLGAGLRSRRGAFA